LIHFSHRNCDGINQHFCLSVGGVLACRLLATLTWNFSKRRLLELQVKRKVVERKQLSFSSHQSQKLPFLSTTPPPTTRKWQENSNAAMELCSKISLPERKCQLLER